MTQALSINPIPTAPKEVRQRVLRRDKNRCVYCFAPAEGTDHIIPRGARGSTNKLNNLVAACSSCNTAASNRVFSNLAEKKAFVRKWRMATEHTCARETCRDRFPRKVWWQRFCSSSCAAQQHVEKYWRQRLAR